jgi:hypothetical protein
LKVRLNTNKPQTLVFVNGGMMHIRNKRDKYHKATHIIYGMSYHWEKKETPFSYPWSHIKRRYNVITMATVQLFWIWKKIFNEDVSSIAMQNYKWEHTNMSIDHLTIITFQQNKIRVHQCFIILYCTTKYKFMISNRLSIIGGDVRKCRKNIISKADFIKRKCFVCTSPLLYSTLLYNISSWSQITFFGLNMRTHSLLCTSSLQQTELMIIHRFPDTWGNIKFDGWSTITLSFYGIHWGPTIIWIARTTSLGKGLPHMRNVSYISEHVGIHVHMWTVILMTYEVHYSTI